MRERKERGEERGKRREERERGDRREETGKRKEVKSEERGVSVVWPVMDGRYLSENCSSESAAPVTGRVGDTSGTAQQVLFTYRERPRFSSTI